MFDAPDPSWGGSLVRDVPERLTGKPIAAAGVERLYFRPFQAGHVALHRVTDPGLDVGQMSVALGKGVQQLLVQLGFAAGIRGVEPVLLVDRLPELHAPLPAWLLHEVIEPAG